MLFLILQTLSRTQRALSRTKSLTTTTSTNSDIQPFHWHQTWLRSSIRRRHRSQKTLCPQTASRLNLCGISLSDKDRIQLISTKKLHPHRLMISIISNLSTTFILDQCPSDPRISWYVIVLSPFFVSATKCIIADRPYRFLCSLKSLISSFPIFSDFCF